MKLKLSFVLTVFVCFSQGVAHGTIQKLPLKGENILNKTAVLVGQQKSKGVVVVFLSSECPCSDSHIEELKELVKDFPNFEFVGIHSNMNEDLEASRNYFAAKNLPFPVIQDAIQDHQAKLATDFNAYKTPHVFVLKTTGDILYKGGVTNSAQFKRSNKKFLREALQDISADREVQTPEGRTLGCVIARSK